MSERRRQKLVNQFQVKLMFRMVTYWAVYQFTLWNFMFCWKLYGYGRGNLWEQYRQFSWEFSPMLICFLILVPAFVWDAVKFYHRIAGPLVRVKRSLRDIANECPTRPMRLRDNDELKELQDVFNDMLATLVKRGAVKLVNDEESNSGIQQDLSLTIDSQEPVNREISHV